MGAVIVKPATLFSGQGIYKYRYTDDAAARALYEQLHGRGFHRGTGAAPAPGA